MLAILRVGDHGAAAAGRALVDPVRLREYRLDDMLLVEQHLCPVDGDPWLGAWMKTVSVCEQLFFLGRNQI
jgi:hypothetical protein